MTKTLTVAGAVAAALACSSSFALTPTQIYASTTLVTISVSGSSAFRDEMANALGVLCAAGTLDTYAGDATGNGTRDPTVVRNAWDGYSPTGAAPFYSYNGPDFRAYACTLVNPTPASAPALAPLAGNDILVYYRAEGGSVWGPWPQINGAKIMHLFIPNPASVSAGGGGAVAGPGNEGCYLFDGINKQDNGVTTGSHPGSNEDGHHWLCSVPNPIAQPTGSITPPAGSPVGWWLPYDNFTGTGLGSYPDSVDLVCEAPTVGVSDVEPAALQVAYANYPKNYKSCDGTSFGLNMPSGYTALTVTPVLQQQFGVILDTGGTATSKISNLSRQSINGLLSGHYTDWTAVPETAGLGLTAPLPVTVCRRDPGSGTQTMTSIYFLNQYCGQAAPLEGTTAFAVPNGTSVQQFPTTGDVQACVGANPDSIGLTSLGTLGAPAGGKFITINNTPATQTSLLTGAWQDWTDVVFTTGTTFNASTPAGELASGLVQNTSDATSGAVKSGTGYAYIPNAPQAQAGDNTPSVANLAKFIAVGDKGGKTCAGITQPINTN